MKCKQKVLFSEWIAVFASKLLVLIGYGNGYRLKLTSLNIKKNTKKVDRTTIVMSTYTIHYKSLKIFNIPLLMTRRELRKYNLLGNIAGSNEITDGRVNLYIKFTNNGSF